MVRSRLPVASFLGLFGALLLLSPEFFMGSPESLNVFGKYDPRLPKLPITRAFAIEENNKNRRDSPNYFKALRIAEKRSGETFYFLVELAKTTCKKKPGFKIVYENIQKCKLLPSSQKKPICFFSVFEIPRFICYDLRLEVTFCDLDLRNTSIA